MSDDVTVCPLCTEVMPAADYRRHYLEAHELEAERFRYCRACGRPVPSRYIDTMVDGMHPGCHRKRTGRKPR